LDLKKKNHDFFSALACIKLTIWRVIWRVNNI